MKITVRIYNKKNRLVRYRVSSFANWRKIYGLLASAAGYKWYIRVYYGYGKNVFGKRVMFKNEEEYFKVSEAKRALSIFMEK
jgi:hypothetical protein